MLQRTCPAAPDPRRPPQAGTGKRLCAFGSDRRICFRGGSCGRLARTHRLARSSPDGFGADRPSRVGNVQVNGLARELSAHTPCPHLTEAALSGSMTEPNLPDVPTPPSEGWRGAKLFGRSTPLGAVLGAMAPPLDLRILGRTLLHTATVGLAAGLVGAVFFAALEYAQSFSEHLAGDAPLRAHGEEFSARVLVLPSFVPSWCCFSHGRCPAGRHRLPAGPRDQRRRRRRDDPRLSSSGWRRPPSCHLGQSHRFNPHARERRLRRPRGTHDANGRRHRLGDRSRSQGEPP